MKRVQIKPISEHILAKVARLNLPPVQKRALEEILAAPIAYMPDERFSQKSVIEPIMKHQVTARPNIPLSTEEEQILFLQMNYTRHQMCKHRRHLLRQGQWKEKDVQRLLEEHQDQLECRSKIVTANMGLVLSMVKQAKYPSIEFTDLVSEGSMALLRAAEKFDCARGFKFSTYACRAILKGFSRTAKQDYKYRSLFPTQLDDSMEKYDKTERDYQESRKELIDEIHAIMNNNLADLSEIEMSVLQMRFSLEDEQLTPLTLKQAGAKLHLTKERIRQIQNNALKKMRTIAEERLVPI
jgi:RNA polymerase sigma factor (sigma-70 family)